MEAALAKPTLGERLNAAVYDPFLWLGERLGMRERRAQLLAPLSGRVLEVGAGTGLNLRHYPAAVAELLLTEPDPGMAARLARRLDDARPSARVIGAPADSLPCENDSIDAVVSTMVLCTVPDPGAALAEIERVLRPGGRLVFCEHVLAEDGGLQRWQRRLAGAWEGFADGCRCDRPTLELISDALTLKRVERDRWRGMPPIVHPLVVGEAVAR